MLCTVRRRLGPDTTEGEAFGWMLDHTIAVWSLDANGSTRVRREHRVFERDGWRCTVPGCSSYRNLHDHHIIFRSAGGSNALTNRTTLCAAHHLRGVHAGVVRCRGVDLLSEEVETHLHAGKQVARLSLGWDERLQLVLAEDLCLRRLRFADELVKENEDIAEGDAAARLDADFALMADAIGSLQQRILALFGGEAQ